MSDKKGPISITLPLKDEDISALRAGDKVLLSGTIYTLRDAGHARLCNMIRAGEELPLELDHAVIYYAGPSPAPEGRVIGSVGPTTSGRMDAYAPLLMSRGLRGMIGKGRRSAEVTEAIVKYGCVYFGAIGGMGALLSESVKESEVTAFEDLGTEALRKLRVKDMPLTVLTDCLGNDLYSLGPERFRTSRCTGTDGQNDRCR